jgi:hypothetical protein
MQNGVKTSVKMPMMCEREAPLSIHHFSEESVGEKMESAGESIRDRRDTVGQNIDQGIDSAKQTGENISEWT